MNGKGYNKENKRTHDPFDEVHKKSQARQRVKTAVNRANKPESRILSNRSQNKADSPELFDFTPEEIKEKKPAADKTKRPIPLKKTRVTSKDESTHCYLPHHGIEDDFNDILQDDFVVEDDDNVKQKKFPQVAKSPAPENSKGETKLCAPPSYISHDYAGRDDFSSCPATRQSLRTFPPSSTPLSKKFLELSIESEDIVNLDSSASESYITNRKRRPRRGERKQLVRVDSVPNFSICSPSNMESNNSVCHGNFLSTPQTLAEPRLQASEYDYDNESSLNSSEVTPSTRENLPHESPSESFAATTSVLSENDRSRRISGVALGFSPCHGVEMGDGNVSSADLFSVHESSHMESLRVDSGDAEKKVLDLCDQTEFVSFTDCIPARMMGKCVKIGEGVYGEVFKSFSNGKPVALKIIPIEGDALVNDCPQKRFDEILPEIVIARELSDLAMKKFNTSSNFCQVNRISCVQGAFPQPLLEQWDQYAERKKSENDRPDFFTEEQLFIVFEFVNGGCALESFKFQSQQEVYSVLRQVVYALAVAEQELEFEHRDLHIGNVLVKSCQEETVTFVLEDSEYKFPTEGVFATIIDFTISRLKKDGCAVFCDVSTDDGLFEGSGDIQFDVYRDMRTNNENNWEDYHPYTNVLWTSYLCSKLLATSVVKKPQRGDRRLQQHLRKLNHQVLKHRTCTDLAFQLDFWMES